MAQRDRARAARDSRPDCREHERRRQVGRRHLERGCRQRETAVGGTRGRHGAEHRATARRRGARRASRHADGAGGENSRTAAFRSVEDICRLAEPVGIKVALELIPNPLSDAASLVTILDRDLDFPRTGICLDFGHAFLMGDVPDAIEAVAEHLVTTHVHDNAGKKDDHLVPFEGRINWDMALMTMQKVGYDGTYLMELANTGSPADVLQKAQGARKKFEKLLSY